MGFAFSCWFPVKPSQKREAPQQTRLNRLRSPKPRLGLATSLGSTCGSSGNGGTRATQPSSIALGEAAGDTKVVTKFFTIRTRLAKARTCGLMGMGVCFHQDRPVEACLEFYLRVLCGKYISVVIMKYEKGLGHCSFEV